MRVEESDLAKLKGLKALVAKGTYELQGEALIKAATLVVWLNELEGKFEESLNPKPLEAKEIKDKVKKL